MEQSVIFLGLADHVQQDSLPYPVGPVNIFKLSQVKTQIIFPQNTNGWQWVFLVSGELIAKINEKKVEIKINFEDKREWQSIALSGGGEIYSAKEIEAEPSNPPKIPLAVGFKWALFYISIDGIIPDPSVLIVVARVEDEDIEIGRVRLRYQKVPPHSPEQIKAIVSDPFACKEVLVFLGCKSCHSKLKTYSALKRNPTLESQGAIWQYDLNDHFQCSCGKTNLPLKYIRESLHGILGKDLQLHSPDIKYERLYGHSEILKIVRKYKELLRKEPNEPPFQNFLEKNPVLLARFYSKKLYLKPNILGKYQPDFALLDTEGKLVLIELEKPTLKLFKKDGHPTAALMHAYGQVRDWLHEYEKHRSAFLDGLGLKPEEVMAVRGCVIAGEKESAKSEHLQRHLSKPLYNDVDFITLNDLSESLLQISHDL